MNISKIGILAGSGDFPKIIVESCLSQNKEIFIVGIKGFVESKLLEEHESIEVGIAKAGKIIKSFQEAKVDAIIFAGKVSRPDFKSLIPDAKGIKILNKINNLSKKGDNDIFEVLIDVFENEGIKLIGVNELCSDLLADEGNIGKTAPSKEQLKDIEIGFKAAKKIGEIDLGQAVIVKDKNITSVEAIDGTDALIKRNLSLPKEFQGGILIKVKKPKQDSRIDLPTIGVQTINSAIEAGLNGIAFEAESSILLNKEEIIKIANNAKIFLYGIKSK